MIHPKIPKVSKTYIKVEVLTAGAGFNFQIATTPGAKEKVVRVAETSPISSVVLSFIISPYRLRMCLFYIPYNLYHSKGIDCILWPAIMDNSRKNYGYKLLQVSNKKRLGLVLFRLCLQAASMRSFY